MTPRVLSHAALALAAAREVGDGPVEHMKAVAIILRNRWQGGWYDDLMDAVEDIDTHSAHDPREIRLRGDNRTLQKFAFEIENCLYEGMSGLPDQEGGGLNKAKYWCFLDRPLRDRFKTTIIRDKENHPQKGVIGLMLYFD